MCVRVRVPGVRQQQAGVPGDGADARRRAAGPHPQAEVLLGEGGQRCAAHHHSDRGVPALPGGETTPAFTPGGEGRGVSVAGLVQKHAQENAQIAHRLNGFSLSVVVAALVVPQIFPLPFLRARLQKVRAHVHTHARPPAHLICIGAQRYTLNFG